MRAMPERLAEHAQAMAFEQRFRVRRRQAETVDELFVHRVERFLGFAIGEPLVDHEALVNVVAVVFGQQARARAG